MNKVEPLLWCGIHITRLELCNIDRNFDSIYNISARRLSIPLFVIICLVTGCATKPNYAPVRSYSRDLQYGNKFYQVKQRDTLYSIGFRSGHGYQNLARWNNISPPYRLKIGQKIKLFKPKYKIKKPSWRATKTRRMAKMRTPSQKKIKKKLAISYNNGKLLKLFWQWPLKGKILKGFSQKNKGLDIFGLKGQKVKSAASGKVVYSGDGLIGYGNLLIIKHNYLYLSAYANNSRLLVKEGQMIKKGQVIAEVGRVKGKQTSLHFEIRKNGKPVDPLRYLPK